MISPKERIERAYENANPDKIIFTDKNWNRRTRILSIILALLLALTFGVLYTLGYDWTVLFLCVLWVGAALLGFYTFVNTHAKRQLVRLRLKPTRGFFKHWANTPYFEFKLKCFFKQLRAEKILTETSRDIEILDDCLVLFDKESEHLFKKGEYLVVGALSVLVIFIVPVWTKFVEMLFENNKDKAIEVLSFCTKILLTLFFFLILTIFFKRRLDDYYNARSSKMKEISRHLRTIRINLKIKYSRE